MARIAAQAQASPPPPRRVPRALWGVALAAGLVLVWGALQRYIDLRVEQAVDASFAARHGLAPPAPRDTMLEVGPGRRVVIPEAIGPQGPGQDAETTETGPVEAALPETGGAAGPSRARAPRGAPELDADELLREGALLSRAREAQARGDWSRVLELVDAHRAAHPQGGLLEERLVLEAAAACSAGQRARGQKAARALRKRFPRSLALARVAEVCEDTGHE